MDPLIRGLWHRIMRVLWRAREQGGSYTRPLFNHPSDRAALTGFSHTENLTSFGQVWTHDFRLILGRTLRHQARPVYLTSAYSKCINHNTQAKIKIHLCFNNCSPKITLLDSLSFIYKLCKVSIVSYHSHPRWGGRIVQWIRTCLWAQQRRFHSQSEHLGIFERAKIP